jgi:Methyltransferase domain
MRATCACVMNKKAQPKPLHETLGLRAGQSLDLLQALHIVTREGGINQDSRRKLKQVNHLVQFIEPLLADCYANTPDPVLVDHGAGKSYLGFMLYDWVIKQHEAGRVVGVESRSELVAQSRQLAAQLGFTRMAFLDMPSALAQHSETLPAQIDIVTALHACNTATDDAIAFGLQKNARHLVLVPCCQAEVASVLRAGKSHYMGDSSLSELWRRPLHTREFGSQVTNVLRCLQLESAGYQVTVTELVGWEHSMKNELILASRLPQSNRSGQARDKLVSMLDALHLEPLRERFMRGLPA